MNLIITGSLFLSLTTSAVSYMCYSGHGSLPELEHCFELTEKIRIFARLPGQREVKEWGRLLKTGRQTENLPKLYWIKAPETRTCSIELDVRDDYPDAVEHFKLMFVASFSDVVIIKCLAGMDELGMTPLGARGLVLAKLQTRRWPNSAILGAKKLMDFGNQTSLWSADIDSFDPNQMSDLRDLSTLDTS
ncbi:MAG: hypothetical protein Q9190_000545 [Brigantiaea leucoxantha]